MGFRLRSLRLGLLTLLLVAMTAIPSAWYFQAPGTAFGPVACMAGGTPDETLRPHPALTSGRQSEAVSPRGSDSTERSRMATDNRIGAVATANLRDHLIAVWTFVRAMSLRH